MAAVYLLRHGQASFGADDYDVLSRSGELQSTVLGDELRRREVPAHAAWSGTLRRQLATAAACLPAAGMDLEVRQDPRWNEYDHLGLVSHDGLDSRRFQEVLDSALREWLSGGPAVGGSGTWASFSAGALAALDDVFADLPRGRSALVFTSAGVIAAVCARLLDLPPSGYLALNRTMANGSITKVVRGRSGTSLVSVNEHAHFEGLHRDLLSYR
jgi:broad specificity phosphatase PhoE